MYQRYFCRSFNASYLKHESINFLSYIHMAENFAIIRGFKKQIKKR